VMYVYFVLEALEKCRRMAAPKDLKVMQDDFPAGSLARFLENFFPVRWETKSGEMTFVELQLLGWGGRSLFVDG
jgi:hypothetical protein